MVSQSNLQGDIKDAVLIFANLRLVGKEDLIRIV